MTTALRNTGIEPVGEMPWGTHFCHFYETRDDLLETLLPFFKAGLEAGEFCAWVVSEPLTEEEVWQTLDRAVPGLDRYVSDQSIEVLKARDVYLAGGEIDLHRITSNWSAKLERALSRGYQGIRVSGNTAWLEQKHWRDFMEYEAELNRGIGDQPMVVLCTYPLTTSGATEFLDVAGTHQVAVPKRRGRRQVGDAPALDEAVESMQLVIRDAQRAGDVIAHARALVKKSDGEKSLVDVDQMIREVLSLVQPEVQKHAVVVEEALAEGLPPVLGDRIRLQQLVLNLIMNGIDAMAGVTARPRRLIISCERGQREDGPGVLVGVQDAGVGAAAHDLEKLFDPFFTTKRDGLGMGLSIGRSIAQAHGGRLWARRNADHGLTFHLLLPEKSTPRV